MIEGARRLAIRWFVIATACGLIGALPAGCDQHDQSVPQWSGVPTLLQKSVTLGGPNPAPTVLKLTNSGECPLNVSVGVDTASGGNWLSVGLGQSSIPLAGSTDLTVNLDVIQTALRPGTYSGSIVVSAKCDNSGRPVSGSPAVIQVNLTVTDADGTFSVGGTVSGLTGSGLTLRLGNGNLRHISANGPYAFPIADGQNYTISISVQPNGQTCSIANASGTINGASIDTVDVSCGTRYKLGGRVFGLLGTGLQIKNGAETLTIDDNGSFAFTTEYLQGSGYDVVVVTPPSGPAQSCDVWRWNGTVGTADITDLIVRCEVPVVGLYDTAGLSWNHYVKNDGSDGFSAGGVDCDGTEPGFYSACLHSGEMLSFDVPGKADCNGVTAQDDLDAFEWTCIVDTPHVRIVSTRLNPWRGLADLINFSGPGWKPNSVTVLENTDPILVTESAAWHNNPLRTLNLQSTAIELNEPRAIYLVSADGSGTLNISASHVGVVTAPEVVLTGTGAVVLGAVTTQSNTRFVWIEGTYKGGGKSNTIRLQGSRFTVLHQVRAQDKDIVLNNASSNRLSQIFLTRANDGILLDAGSTLNLIEGVTLFGQSQHSIRVHGFNNLLADVTAASGKTGVKFDGATSAPSNVLFNATLALVTDQALWLNQAPDSTAMNIVAVNGSHGIYLSGATTTAQIHNIAASNTFQNALNAGTGIQLLNGSSASWSGLFKVGNNKADCRIGTLEVNCATGLTISGSVEGNISTALSFVGPASSDSVNLSQNPANSGTAPYSTGLDFLQFQNNRRGWGKDGLFPSDEIKGECLTGTCRIWDFTLKSTDQVLAGVVPTPISGPGAVTLVHRWSVSGGATECATIPGASWNVSECSTTFLANAIELSGDGVGNDNLLCEAGERCLHTQNIGAYQGRGVLIDLGLVGPANDIRLYRYTDSGE